LQAFAPIRRNASGSYIAFVAILRLPFSADNQGSSQQLFPPDSSYGSLLSPEIASALNLSHYPAPNVSSLAAIAPVMRIEPSSARPAV